MTGLYDKYVVTRTDGKATGRVFVLAPETDDAARHSLYAYALHTCDQGLARDIYAWLRRIEQEEASDE